MGMPKLNHRIPELSFRSQFHKYRKIARAIFTRLILCGHAVLGIWWVGSTLDKGFYGLLAASLTLFALETGIILYFRSGCEWKRFCTPFAVYLTSLVPVLWKLKLHSVRNSGGTGNNNETTTISTTITTPDPTNVQAVIENAQLGKFFADENVPTLLEQSMMFVIILCRWLLPRGIIDRSSLSQLLIMYSAISADILDFSEIFQRNSAIQNNNSFKYIFLTVWSWSLVQFTLVVTTSFTVRRRKRQTEDQESDNSQDKSETLSILMVFFMQDGPFFITRCYAIFVIHLRDYQIMFFTLKNGLTLVLALYRLFVLCGCITREGNDLLRKSEIARSMESLDDIDGIKPKKSKKGKRKKKKDVSPV